MTASAAGVVGWTGADQAELDVLVWELVTRVPEHRRDCDLCARERAEGWPCARVTEAIEAVLAWRVRRALLSRAERLREEQADHETFTRVPRFSRGPVEPFVGSEPGAA